MRNIGLKDADTQMSRASAEDREKPAGHGPGTQKTWTERDITPRRLDYSLQEKQIQRFKKLMGAITVSYPGASYNGRNAPEISS